MTDNRQRKTEIDNLNATISRPLAMMRPPECKTVTEWADKKRHLSSESSAEVGRWRTSRTPYLAEVMNAFSDAAICSVVMVASSQVGKSECLNNVIGASIDEDPSSILFINPTQTDAKEYSKLRIAPMIRDTPSLRAKVAKAKSRDSANTILQKSYPGGILTLCGSTEAHSLASKPIRRVLGDEVDRWAKSAGTEGDPWKLATARQITFYNAKNFRVSTPTVRGSSPIAAAFEEGTQEHWCHQCPHCGEFHEITFDDIRFEKEETVVNNKKAYRATSVWYVCPECACVSDEQTMKKQPAKWIATNPEALKRGVRSFWLKGFASPWSTWLSIVQEYLDALNDPEKLQVVYNTRFGELWEDRGDIPHEDEMLSRRESYGVRADGSEIELPDGVLVLTCGVDTQDDRLEYEVVGYGMFGETWGIKVGIIMGRPDLDATWEQLDDVIDHVYHFADGFTGLRIARTFVDEGGHFTQHVRQQCRRREGKRVFAIKGIAGESVPYTAPPKRMKIQLNNRYLGECWQYQIGVDSGKAIIMSNIMVQEAGANYCHFPARDDYGMGYFNGLLSEKKTWEATKTRSRWVWMKLPGHERNEPLDRRNYANAAFVSLSPNLDEIKRRILASRGKATKTAVATRQKTPKRVGAHHNSAVNGGYDW